MSSLLLVNVSYSSLDDFAVYPLWSRCRVFTGHQLALLFEVGLRKSSSPTSGLSSNNADQVG